MDNPWEPAYTGEALPAPWVTNGAQTLRRADTSPLENHPATDRPQACE